MGLCQSLMAENPLYQQFRKSKGGRPPSNHPNQCTQSNSTGTGSVGLSSIGAVNTQYQSNIDPPAVAASSSSMLAASSSSQMSEKLNSLRHDGQDDGIERSEPTSEVILSESYSATAHSSSSSNRYSAMSGDRYQVPPIAPHLVTEKSSNGLLQKTQKYRRKKSENQTVTQLQQKVDLLNYNQQELLQHQQLLKEEYERNLRQLHPLVQQKQQHQYYQEQQQIQSEHHGSGNRQNHQQLQQQQQQQLLSMHPPHTTSSISTNGRFIEGEISPVVKQNSHISQTEGIARMQVFNHNRSNFITSSTSSSSRESISISCDEESIGNDCVLRSERGSLTAGCTADVNRNSPSLIRHRVGMNYNTTAAHLLPDCDHHSNPTHFAGSAYHQELHPNLNKKIDQTADRINLSIRAHSEVECNAAQSRTADVSQDLLVSNMKPDNEQERKRKREKLQYVNYVKKSRDAVKSLHETSVHHNISAFSAGLNIGSNRMINSADNGSGGCQSIFSTKFSGNGNRGISSDCGVEQIDRSSSQSDSIDLHSRGRHSSSATSISHYPSLSASESLVQTIIPYVPLIGGGISNGSRAQIIESIDGNKCDICDDDKSNHNNRTIDSKLVYISSHDSQNCHKSSSAHNPNSFGSSAGGSNGASVRDHASASDMEVTAMLLAMSGKGSGFSNSHTLLPSLLPGHSLPVNTSRCSAYPSISHNDPIFRVDSQQYRSMPSSSSRLRDGSLSGAMATTSASSPNSYLKIDVSGSKSDDEFCSQPL